MDLILPLIPAEIPTGRWSILSPSSISVFEDSILVEWHPATSNINDAPLRLTIDYWCCGGKLYFMFQTWRRRTTKAGKPWLFNSYSIAIYDDPFIEVVGRIVDLPQENGCDLQHQLTLGHLDPDVPSRQIDTRLDYENDFKRVLLRWYNQALTKQGVLDTFKPYTSNPCEEEPLIPEGNVTLKGYIYAIGRGEYYLRGEGLCDKFNYTDLSLPHIQGIQLAESDNRPANLTAANAKNIGFTFVEQIVSTDPRTPTSFEPLVPIGTSFCDHQQITHNRWVVRGTDTSGSSLSWQDAYVGKVFPVYGFANGEPWARKADYLHSYTSSGNMRVVTGGYERYAVMDISWLGKYNCTVTGTLPGNDRYTITGNRFGTTGNSSEFHVLVADTYALENVNTRKVGGKQLVRPQIRNTRTGTVAIVSQFEYNLTPTMSVVAEFTPGVQGSENVTFTGDSSPSFRMVQSRIVAGRPLYYGEFYFGARTVRTTKEFVTCTGSVGTFEPPGSKQIRVDFPTVQKPTSVNKSDDPTSTKCTYTINVKLVPTVNIGIRVKTANNIVRVPLTITLGELDAGTYTVKGPDVPTPVISTATSLLNEGVSFALDFAFDAVLTGVLPVAGRVLAEILDVGVVFNVTKSCT